MAIFAATDAGWAAFVKFFLDGTFVNKDPRMVWLVPAALVGLFILRGIGDYLQTYLPRISSAANRRRPARARSSTATCTSRSRIST